MSLSSQRGQSTVEVVAMLPVAAAVAFALLQALAAGISAQLADHAAEAGAVAILQGHDPQDAVRKALPGWSRSRSDVSVDGRKVRVRLRPPSISSDLARLLETTAHADAGPRAR
jgi:hypothetical protein